MALDFAHGAREGSTVSIPESLQAERIDPALQGLALRVVGVRSCGESLGAMGVSSAFVCKLQ